MGETDVKKQAINVRKMQLLGAEVVCVSSGGKTLKDAVDAAFEEYSKTYEKSLYCIGSVVGPHPYPVIVRDFQSVVGREARAQFKRLKGGLPTRSWLAWEEAPTPPEFSVRFFRINR